MREGTGDAAPQAVENPLFPNHKSRFLATKVARNDKGLKLFQN
jgi:hypothetical protein